VITYITLTFITLTFIMARRPKIVLHVPNPNGGKKKYIEVPLEYPSGSDVDTGAKRAALDERQEGSSKRRRSDPSFNNEVLERGSALGSKKETEHNNEKVRFFRNSVMILKASLV